MEANASPHLCPPSASLDQSLAYVGQGQGAGMAMELADFKTQLSVKAQSASQHSNESGYTASPIDSRVIDVDDRDVKELAAEVSGTHSLEGTGGTWQHASAHMMTVTFGAGVLSLPYAFRWLGMAWGLVLLAFALAVSYHSSYLLAGMAATGEGAGSASYRELGAKLLGERAARWIITPLQWSVLIGTPLVYFILGGESLLSVYDTACELSGGSSCPAIPLWAWTLMFTFACLLVAPAKSIHEVRWMSTLAAVMSLSYGLMACVTSGMDLAEFGPSGQCDVGSVGVVPSMTDTVFQALNAIGIIVFAFGGLAVLPEVQATLKPDPTTKQPMIKGYTACIVPTATIYLLVSVLGYLAYGPCTQSNILRSAPIGSGHAETIAAIADLLVAIHVFGSIQIMSQPVMQTLQQGAQRLLPKEEGGSSLLRNPTLQRYCINLSYTAILGGIGAAVPDASSFIGLVGGIGITGMTLVVPSVMFLRSNKGKRKILHSSINYGIVILGGACGVLATIGAGYSFTLPA